MKPVAALFVRADSVYKAIPGVECFDVERNALTFEGGMPVIAHPPCRSWGRMRKFSAASEYEHALAIWALMQVRQNGGVLEHPKYSDLWNRCALPRPGANPDRHGGWGVEINQCDFGYRATKATWLYIVGTNAMPPLPPPGKPTACIRPAKKDDWHLNILSKGERDKTTPELANWLVMLARACEKEKVMV